MATQESTDEPVVLPCTVGDARAGVDAVLRQRGWTGDIDALLLAVQEALVNADRHGGGLREVVLRWGRQIVIDIADFGTPFDWQPYIAEPPDLLAERGRGLWLIGHLATAIDVRGEPAGSRVRLVFDPSDEAGEAAGTPPPDAGADVEPMPPLSQLAPGLLQALGATAALVDRRLVVRQVMGDPTRLLGSGAGEITGRDLRGLLAELKNRFADPQGYEEHVLRAFADPHQATEEVLVLADHRLVRHHTFPLTRDDGAPVGRAVVILPVADQTEVLAALQRSLLPPIPSSERMDFGAIYHPAQASSFLGGDFYDFVDLPSGCCVVVGDVSGRGAAAAATGVRTRAYLRANLATSGMAGAIADLQRALADELGEEQFVTMAMAAQESADVWTLTSCGHPPPLLTRGGQVRELIGGGPLLGVDTTREWGREPFVLHAGEVLLLYTDGVTDAGGRSHRFGVSRLKEALAELAHLPAQELVDGIDARLHAFTSEEIRDDHVLLAVRRR